HADQRVDAPAGEAPVQEGQLHRVARSLGGATLTYWRLEKLGDGFGDTEEQQIDAYTGREKHRRPGDHIEIRLGMIRAEADLAVATGRHYDHKQQVEQYG